MEFDEEFLNEIEEEDLAIEDKNRDARKQKALRRLEHVKVIHEILLHHIRVQTNNYYFHCIFS